MDNLTNVPFRDENDYGINRGMEFDDKTNASFSLVDKSRKKVVHIFTELGRGRCAFEVYDTSNGIPHSMHSSKFDYCSVNSARDDGRIYVEKLPVLSDESSLDRGN